MLDILPTQKDAVQNPGRFTVTGDRNTIRLALSVVVADNQASLQVESDLVNLVGWWHRPQRSGSAWSTGLRREELLGMEDVQVQAPDLLGLPAHQHFGSEFVKMVETNRSQLGWTVPASVDTRRGCRSS
jgi:hypothetical protein